MRPRLDIVLAALVGLALVAFLLAISLGGSSGHSPSVATSTTADSGFDGAALPQGLVAPPFTLVDQAGHRESLTDSRGRVRIVAFLYSTCGNTCVLIAQQIRGALDELEEHGRPPAVLIVSADPMADTPARVREFLGEASLSGRVRYLTGSPAQLRRVWSAYRVKPASAGRKTFDEYATVLLVDGKGDERDLFQLEQLTPESLVHDIDKLEGDATNP